MFRAACIAAAVLALPSAALAEVRSSAADAFTLRYEAVVPVPPETAYAALGEVGRWWESAHTYSGDANNLTLALQPGGCFCETLGEGGGVEHGRVVLAWPARTLRLNAALGPLQETDPAAVLTVGFEAGEGGGAKVTATYVVHGAGVGAMAAAVDQVLQIQFDRYVGFAGRRP